VGEEVFIPLITPLDSAQRVCGDSVAALIASTRSFASGYVPCLTSGEGWLLSDEQWQAMVKACIRHAENLKVIAGIEKPLSHDVIRVAHLAESLGTDAVMITSPFGREVSQQAIYEHFVNVHKAINIDIYIYNENSLSKNIIAPETLVKIADLPRVVGIKESMNQDFDPLLIASLKDNDIKVYQGWENRIVNDALSDGNICSLSNLFPELCLLAAQANTDELEPKINELCREFGIYEDNWYEHIKTHLSVNDVISSDRTLS